MNHAWRMVGLRLWRDKESYSRFMRLVGFVLTFLAVAVAMVLFLLYRSEPPAKFWVRHGRFQRHLLAATDL
ncbi:MAG: hypothetical protein U1E63_02120 [Burkholderiales bacterium]